MQLIKEREVIMAFNWKGLIGTVAPILAGTIKTANPLAGLALSAISNKFLGKPDGTEDEVSAYLEKARPEDLETLMKIETAFKLDMEKAGVDLEKIHADDRADARAREITTGDTTTRRLAAVYTIGYFICFGSILKWGIPQEPGTKEIVIGLISIMSTVQTAIIYYYFGSSKGSADKTKMLAGK